MNYFRRLIDDKDPASAKRFLGLAMSAFIILAAFVLLFTRITNANAALLDRILLYAFLIVLMSLFGLAIEKVADILLQVSKTQAAAQILTPQPTVTKVDTVQGDVNGSTVDNAPKVDDKDYDALKEDLKNSIKNM